MKKARKQSLKSIRVALQKIRSEREKQDLAARSPRGVRRMSFDFRLDF
jgi:hypothetical protein